ncbi:hypothetical protein EYF80_014421 [Liparis tanakae]|uniref:Uncharacterized protein n=1 Tax=Liparis tanakae TaxID=230148 RepID=A0A4Z2IDB2_9TELE|nr:hypothetical protein EYF80_014421 [Liparis tanakae]
MPVFFFEPGLHTLWHLFRLPPATGPAAGRPRLPHSSGHSITAPTEFEGAVGERAEEPPRSFTTGTPVHDRCRSARLEHRRRVVVRAKSHRRLKRRADVFGGRILMDDFLLHTGCWFFTGRRDGSAIKIRAGVRSQRRFRGKASQAESHGCFHWLYTYNAVTGTSSGPDLPSPCTLIFPLSPYSTFLPAPKHPGTHQSLILLIFLLLSSPLGASAKAPTADAVVPQRSVFFM